MNPRLEALARLDSRYDARVLEPSPPALNDAPWFADDPVGREEAAGSLPRVSPVGGSGLRWEDLLADHPDLAPWCSARWLAAYRRLVEPPSSFVTTRLALHALAERVISPARAAANGKIGLRFTAGGFGTPFFGQDVQVRVLEDQLILQSADIELSAPITTLKAASEHLGPELLPDQVDDDAKLDVDRGASLLLGDWFGFGASVLEELRAGAGDDLEPSRVQIWPEHFDIAVEIGSESAGRRAGYGASPGDEEHPEPYLYVVPWGEVPDGELWQASAFAGAELSYRALLDAEDQRARAVSFFTERLQALSAL